MSQFEQLPDVEVAEQVTEPAPHEQEEVSDVARLQALVRPDGTPYSVPPQVYTQTTHAD